MVHDEENPAPDEPDEIDNTAPRAWIHPSELPNFQGTIPAEIPRKQPSWVLRSAAGIVVLGLIAGGLIVGLSHDSRHPSGGTVATLADAPLQIQPSAASMVGIQVTSAEGGMTEATGLIVGGGAVVATTLPIPASSAVTIQTEDHRTLSASVLHVDSVTGIALLAPSETLPAPTDAPAATTNRSGVTSIALLAAHASPTIRWAPAMVSSTDAPLMVHNVAIGTLRAGSPLSGIAGSALVAADGSLLALAAPNLGAHVYLPATFVESVAVMMMHAPVAHHGTLKIEACTSKNGGAEVVSVDQSGPASGQLAAGDIVTAVGTTHITSVSDLVDALYTFPASNAVTLTVTRRSSTQHATITLTPST